jgi:hypothetical protein
MSDRKKCFRGHTEFRGAKCVTCAQERHQLVSTAAGVLGLTVAEYRAKFGQSRKNAEFIIATGQERDKASRPKRYWGAQAAGGNCSFPGCGRLPAGPGGTGRCPEHRPRCWCGQPVSGAGRQCSEHRTGGPLSDATRPALVRLNAAIDALPTPTPCSGEEWFIGDRAQMEVAATACHWCPVIELCAAAGKREKHGVWGGQVIGS